MSDLQDTTTTEETGGLNRRQALGWASAVAAGAVGASVLTAPAAAAKEGSGHGGVLPMATISLDLAKKVVQAGVKYSQSKGFKMFVLVVDACGDEKASARMDGNGPASTVLVPIKAKTAIDFRTPSIDFSGADAARIASFTTAGYSVIGGGRPIEVDGMVIGAIAVGGGSPEQDDEVAAAAIAAVFG
jgi:glc operon protein GlcG